MKNRAKTLAAMLDDMQVKSSNYAALDLRRNPTVQLVLIYSVYLIVSKRLDKKSTKLHYIKVQICKFIDISTSASARVG